MKVIDSAEAAAEAPHANSASPRTPMPVQNQKARSAAALPPIPLRSSSGWFTVSRQPTGKVKLVDMSGWVDNVFFVTDIL